MSILFDKMNHNSHIDKIYRKFLLEIMIAIINQFIIRSRCFIYVNYICESYMESHFMNHCPDSIIMT